MKSQSYAFGLIVCATLTSCKEEEVIENQLDHPPACITAHQLTEDSETGPLFFSSRFLESAEETLWLRPELLRILVLGGNRSLLVGSVQVRKAKSSVNLARAELLPSLNLGALLGSSISPNFLLSSVTYALPFLLPSKWADYRQSKALLKSEKTAFLTTQLNELSSAYALFLAVDNGFKIRRFLQDDYRDASIVEALTAERVEIGDLAASELDLARSQVTTLRARLWRLQRQVDQEIAYLRQALGICQDVSFGIESSNVEISSLERLDFESAVEEVKAVSTELAQLRALEVAAREGRWSKRFSFIGPVSAGESVSGLVPGQDLTFSFSNLMGQASVNFGFAHFARIQLSSRNVEEVQARMLEAQMEIRRILEINFSALKAAAEQYEAIDQSVKLLKRVFVADQRRFREREISLQDLIETQARLRQARLERLQVQTDINLARLSLHRMHRSEIFKHVRGCAFGIRPEFEDEDPIEAPCNEEYVKRKLGMKDG
jgi:outer membrane protein TolC